MSIVTFTHLSYSVCEWLLVADDDRFVRVNVDPKSRDYRKFVVYTAGFAARATLEKIILFDMEGLRHFEDDMCLSYESLLALGDDYAAQHPGSWEEAIDGAGPEDLLTLTYTSGTTGPKAR